MNDKQVTFIASGGRTGTQFFGDLLGDVISDCHSEHEPDLFAGISRLTLSRMRQFGFWHMLPGRLLGQTGVRVIGQRYLEGRLSAAQARSRLEATRQTYHKALAPNLVVESYYAWWMFSKDLPLIWPGARLAGILRDPRNWIASWLQRSARRRDGALTERLPPGPLLPKKLGDDAAARLWPELDQIGRLAWEWALIARALTEAASQNDAVAVFRFEDVFGGDTQELTRFVTFVADHSQGPRHEIGDLSALRRDVRNASSGNKPRWTDWNDAQIAAIDHFCGALMATYGYGADPDWQDRVTAARESCPLPG